MKNRSLNRVQTLRAAIISVFAAMTLLNVNAVFSDAATNDDTIIKGSECIGLDTLRLKENNLRIHFHDTSTTGDFPSNSGGIAESEPLLGIFQIRTSHLSTFSLKSHNGGSNLNCFISTSEK